MEITDRSIFYLDTITVNYSDSAVSERLKLNQYTGVGEKRIYIRSCSTPNDLDEFFFRFTNGTCFILRDDLLLYLRDAYYEFNYPTQEYRNNISEYYNDLISMVSSLPPKITLSFTRTHDTRKRYYLVCERTSRDNLNVLSEICLPQITKLSFVKFLDSSTNETYIQLRPFFFRIDLTGSNHPNYYQSIPESKSKDIIKKIEEVSQSEVNEDLEDVLTLPPSITRANDRPWQSEWKEKVYEDTMHCAVSKCSEDRILVGCHIKPVAVCLKDKCGNETNRKNGIMLTPTFHKLFDSGFLSFDNDNRLLLSSHISARNYERLNIKNNQTTSILDLKPRLEFLEWHRKNIFKDNFYQ